MASITPDSESVAPPQNASSLVLRNALFLSAAQLASLPLSILLNASMARYLGAAALGHMYLGTTYNGFGFLLVEWGQPGALPAMVATNRARAGALLGSSLAFRLPVSLLVTGAIFAICTLLGYTSEARTGIFVFSIAYIATTTVNACQDVILGFERTDIGAVRQICEQLLSVLLVIPVMMLGGKLPLALAACALATLLAGTFVWSSLKRVGVQSVTFDSQTLRELLVRGTPFVFLNLAMALQANIDAVFLSKFASAEAVGWHAATRKLSGLLVFPATTLIGALYPTLCRLFAASDDEFRKTTADALRGVSLLVMPIALGCAFYPQIGLTIYGKQEFGPAADNLRVQAVVLFLLYFTMPIGVCLMAMGKQRIWAVVQSACVVVSATLDPFLVGWFQRRTGNGGLGIGVAGIVSELIVVVSGVALAPRGLFGRSFWASMLPAAGSGLAMAAVAHLLRDWNAFVAAPIALIAYVVALRLTGGLDDQSVAVARAFLERKLGRFARKTAG